MTFRPCEHCVFFRWQRRYEPIDARYVGASFHLDVYHGLHAPEETVVEENAGSVENRAKNMDEMKAKWGF